MNSREAAFLAFYSSLKEEKYITDFLTAWKQHSQVSPQDYHLAQQIAYGSSQMAVALDYLMLQASEKKKIQLKLKERTLLRTAIYQLYFLDRLPSYAVVDETIKIAKKYFHSYYINFLNALLRKFVDMLPELPQGKDVQSISIRYSYPIVFVQELVDSFGLEVAIKILETGNHPAPTMVRLRRNKEYPKDWNVILEDPVKVAVIPAQDIETASRDSNLYIQNVTPAYLIGTLCKESEHVPKRVLDLCASPGGKSVAVHDFFSHAQIFANDVSDEKILKIRENFDKYSLNATITCSDGQQLNVNHPFDLIILDVPCSNTGVLNKRPEARWRLDQEHFKQLEKIQLALLKKAFDLLTEDGEIWYMTCSILPRENEDLITKACLELNLRIKSMKKILPNKDGWDGGFSCCLKKNEGRLKGK